MTGSPAPAYQWRVIVDGHPDSGCWIDVADGDFQNIDCAGRLEFRTKPTLTAETGPEERTASDWCAHYGIVVHSADGWKGDGAPKWTDPITLADFADRIARSTATGLLGRLADDAAKASRP